jgi:hypothetical protein
VVRYADSPFLRGEVKGCVHDPTRFTEGRDCAECDRIVVAQREDLAARWARIDARARRPWWKKLLG